MKTKVSPAVVGLFVLGALALSVVALFSFGGINFFSQPQRFKVYFNESISGLDVGSPVKLRGVRVGRVVSLNIRYDQERNQSVVAVVCELSRDSITDLQGNEVDVSDRAVLKEMIDRGLRAQLGVSGLATGLLFIELDFLDPQEHSEHAFVEDDEPYLVVPSAPSTISEFQTNLTEILNDFKRVDFAALGREIRLLLADTRRQLNELDLKGLADQWKQTGASLNALAASPEIKDAFKNLNTVAVDLQATLARLDEQIGPAGENLNDTLTETKQAMASFAATAVTLRRFINAQQNLGEGANQALSRVGDAAAAVERLADFLERNPNALLTGKKRPD